jgi:hypothetical protein
MLPKSLADDLLRGACAIAEFTGFDERQVYHLHERKKLPTFKIGATICARKSELSQRLSAAGSDAPEAA